MCCPSNNVTKRDTRSCLALGGLHGDKLSNGNNQYQNGPSNLLIPYREQPRPTRIVIAYPRQSFSATKRTDHAPISFDQQAQVSQGHTPYIDRGKNLKYRGPWWWRPWAGEAGARASIQPSKAPCIPEKAPRILPLRRSLLALVGRKHAVVRYQLFPHKPLGPRLVFWSRDVGSAVPPRPAHLPFQERIWCLLTGFSPPPPLKNLDAPRQYRATALIILTPEGICVHTFG